MQQHDWTCSNAQSTRYDGRNAYLCRVDLSVDNNPCAASELCTGWQIHNDGLPVGAQVLHYQRASLQPYQQNMHQHVVHSSLICIRCY